MIHVSTLPGAVASPVLRSGGRCPGLAWRCPFGAEGCGAPRG